MRHRRIFQLINYHNGLLLYIIFSVFLANLIDSKSSTINITEQMLDEADPLASPERIYPLWQEMDDNFTSGADTSRRWSPYALPQTSNYQWEVMDGGGGKSNPIEDDGGANNGRRPMQPPLLPPEMIQYNEAGYKINPQDPPNRRGCVGKSLNVTIDLEIDMILDVDESRQVLTMKQSVILVWIDETLKWDPEEYQGLERKYWSAQDVCFPDLTIGESLDTFIMPIKNARTDVEIRYTGQVMAYFPHTFKGFCKLNMKRYPFDRQTCSLEFWSTLQPMKHIDLWPAGPTADLKWYRKHNEWSMVGTKSERYEYFDKVFGSNAVIVTYRVILQRKPLFYILNIIIPSTLVAIVASIGIFTASGSNEVRQEKVRLGIMALLFMAIQLLSVASQLPVTSEHVPMLSIYYGTNILVIAVGIFIAAITIQVHHSGSVYKTPVPASVKFVVFKIMAPMLCMTGKMGTDDDKPSRESSDTRREYTGGATTTLVTVPDYIPLEEHNFSLMDDGQQLGHSPHHHATMNNSTSALPHHQYPTHPQQLQTPYQTQFRHPLYSTGENNVANATHCEDSAIHHLQAQVNNVRKENRKLWDRLRAMESRQNKKGCAAARDIAISNDWLILSEITDRFFLLFFLIVITVNVIWLCSYSVTEHDDVAEE